MSFYPLINKKIINIKDFSDEKVIYLNELNSKKIILNKSAKFIFDSCNGNNSIQDLVSTCLNKYNMEEEDISTVQKDVNDILYKLNTYGIITWKSRNDPFVKCTKINNLEIYPIGLNNKYLIQEQFQNSIFSIGINKEVIYNNKLIVNGIYTKLINSYYIKKDDGKCALIMMNMVDNSLVWQVMAILYNDNFDLIDDFATIYNYIYLDLKKNVYKKEFQLGFYMDIKRENVEVCRLLGFQEKGCLKYESDTEVYSMWRINE